MAGELDNEVNSDIKNGAAELGAKLRILREAQNITIPDVSQHTKIQKHYISAIEDGNLDLLPKGPYTRSFVKQYCLYLEAGDLWPFYDELTKVQKVTVPKHELKDESGYTSAEPIVFKPKSYFWIYLVIAVSIAAACWITWQYRSDISSIATAPVDGGTAVAEKNGENPEQPAEPQTTPVSDNAIAQPVSASISAATAGAGQAPAPASVDLGWMDGKKPEPKKPAVKPLSSDTPAPAPASTEVKTSGELKIIPVSIVWVKVSQNRKTLFEGIIRPGEDKTYTVTGEIPVRVRFGNPGKTNVQWAGNTSLPSESGDKPVTRYYWQDGNVTDKLK